MHPRLLLNGPPMPLMAAVRTLLAALLLAIGGVAAAPAPAAAAAKPNIVYIFTDDMEVELLRHMPNVQALLAAQGARFDRAYFTDPLCCPSRATMLTGLYTHNTKTERNSHGQFYRAGMPARTVAVALKAAGYRTGLFGKYLNAYPGPASTAYVPPGWDDWHALLTGGQYYDYRLEENGKVVSYGSTPADYTTDLFTEKALAFLHASAGSGKPFLAWISYNAPHAPFTPAPRHATLFPDLKMPRPPSFNEADVSDKPAWVRKLPPFGAVVMRRLEDRYRNRVRALMAVDEAVARIVGQLAADGQLANTYILLSTDNGMESGLHRLPANKGTPYEESIRMPLIVRGPGIAPGTVLTHMVANTDLAPTFAEWAGAAMPGIVDGRSFAPLLRPDPPAPDAWRRMLLLSYTAVDSIIPSWEGLRTRDYTYVRYPETGETELYMNPTDPYQLNNKARYVNPRLLTRLQARVDGLKGCVGAVCVTRENTPF